MGGMGHALDAKAGPMDALVNRSSLFRDPATGVI